jgi:hypothetical protein
MLRSPDGELAGKLRVGEEYANGGGCAADFGLLKYVPSFLIHETVEGWARELV